MRNFEDAPTAANINGPLERLRFVRSIGIDASISRSIPKFRFVQFVRKGGVAPSFQLSEYSPNCRRLTLTAAVIDIETKLADAAIQMFNRLVGSIVHARQTRS